MYSLRWKTNCIIAIKLMVIYRVPINAIQNTICRDAEAVQASDASIILWEIFHLNFNFFLFAGSIHDKLSIRMHSLYDEANDQKSQSDNDSTGLHYHSVKYPAKNFDSHTIQMRSTRSKLLWLNSHAKSSFEIQKRFAYFDDANL